MALQPQNAPDPQGQSEKAPVCSRRKPQSEPRVCQQQSEMQFHSSVVSEEEDCRKDRNGEGRRQGNQAREAKHY